LQVFTLQDVLFYLPFRYQDRTRIVPIGTLRPTDEVVIQGSVVLAQVKPGKRRALLVRVRDGSGFITLRFFYFNAAQEKSFEPGRVVRCFGEVRKGPSSLEMVHPEYSFIEDSNESAVSETLTPIYHATEGVQQRTLRNIVARAVDQLQHFPAALPELLPPALLRKFHLPSLHEAILFLHNPPPDVSSRLLADFKHPAQRRLALEELLAQHLSLRRVREAAKQNNAPAMRTNGDLVRAFCAQLPFQLTAAQQRVAEEIRQDLKQPHPMLRLVQGDVGSGKTVIAAIAALQSVEAGYQVAIMAPTELLAEQHWQNFARWFAPLGVNVGWLSGRAKNSERAATLRQLQIGEAPVVVGTHALFQNDVEFHRLGLVIVDEQHRFGVHQRLLLRDKGQQAQFIPHQLVMTATPIPRTLAMTFYADLDLSIIDELPKGRQPIETVVIPDRRRSEIVERVRMLCREKGQVYWVCPLIEESDVLEAEAAENTATNLREALPDCRVGLVHGRLKAAEKENIMTAFRRGEIDLLVATTVIEVGVDVPNASLMVIENAERLGLSQLHQLRGRVGRGSAKSTCLLMYHAPLSQTARERLAAMRETSDGFEIARRDLELRGAGELLGTRQTGNTQFRIADIVRDADLLPAVEEAAGLMLRQNPLGANELINRWVRLGMRYATV
jgi:ATP-dependent DNA helicase RecG